jgi:thiol:disulfide interchange protein DsbC
MTTDRLLVHAAAALLLMAGSASAAPPADTAKTPAAAKAGPDELALLARLKKQYPSTTFTGIAKTPVKGLYEVQMGPNIAYVDAIGRHFLFGHLFDMQTQSDLTAKRQNGENPSPTLRSERVNEGPKPIRLAELPLADAIKRVNGTGARTLVVFSDPMCPYCKRLDAELPALADTTVYTFLIPILGAGSRKAAEAAWAEAMPERARELDVLDRNLALASRYGIQGTPTLIRGSDGAATAGAMPAEQIAAWLDATGKTAQAAGR